MSKNYKFFCWLALLFPFVSPFPIGTDVQPLIFILIIFALIFNLFKVKINMAIMAMLIFASLNIFYININSDYLITKRFGLLAGFLVMAFLFSEAKNLNLETLRNIFLTHIILLFIQLLFPNIFSIIFAPLIRNETYIEGDSRGVHGLNAEPGGAAAVLTGLYFFLILKIQEKNTNKKLPKIILIIVLVGLFLTKSGLSIVCSLMILFYHFTIFKNDRKFLIVPLILTILLLLDLDQSTVRAIGLLKSVSELGINVIFLDGSIAERCLGLLYGVYSLTYTPFGYGGGGYSLGAKIVESNHSLSELFFTARDQTEATISMAGLYMVEYGLLYIIFSLFILFYFRPKLIRSLPIYFLAISFYTFSFSIAFPVTWLLFYLVRVSNVGRFDNINL